VQLLRIQQICGGSVKFDDASTATQICEKASKAAVLSDRLEDLPADEPVVIFCRFTSDIAAAKAACQDNNRAVSELSGHANELADWQAGKTNALVAQIQSGGIGIDLTRASYCFFYSLGYSLSEYEQAVARLHRPGQAATTHIYHLVATINGRATVDGRVYQALRERKEVLNDIIDGLRSRHAATNGAV
jgi:SNF2 family DNA or RNA helicase